MDARMDGYAKVAKLMALHPEFALLRRFTELNIQNLLYLQAEITHLEDSWKDSVAKDAANPNRQYFSRDWWSMSQSDESDSKQWMKWLELREKLEKYNDTLLKVTALSNLQSPNKYELEFLRSWFVRPSMGAFPLLGIDKDAWSPEHEKDLIGLKSQNRPDIFSKWFTETVVPAYHNFLGERYKTPVSVEVGAGIFNYKENILVTIIRILTTVVASILPMLSVTVLYTIDSDSWKLGVVLLFSALFSLALAVMTNGRKIEVFAATAAFAAVNVVFLTNNNTCRA